MKHRLLTIFFILGAMAFTACHKEPHFITDRAYRAQVHKDYEARTVLAARRAEQLFGCMDTLDTRTREAMEFLYAYMPYSDLADYDGAFYLAQVRAAFAARERFSWGKSVPEDIFRHFVLVYRVNNEDLDTARMLMQRELTPRVEGLSMYDAALEVNHWCHEHVAYRAADARTSAPLATMRTSLGRCGEESTFAVTALRSIGIPARQCYTPRWAHCDDNHAWVEVWIDTTGKGDGRWYFMGACEPDAELDMGWFAVPSTRCMMVHSNAFGHYRGTEEVNFAGSLYSKINMLANYAPTQQVTVTVYDAQNRPVEGAEVKYKLYNYSEFYTLATMKTDAEGQTRLTTGYGDLLIWADDGKHYQYAKLDVRQQNTLELYLTKEQGTEYDEVLNIVPPAAGEAKVTPSREKDSLNTLRKAYEDSLRGAYTATFPDRRRALEMVGSLAVSTHTYTPDQIWELIQKSEGNYAEIAEFMRNNTISRAHEHYYDYLKSFSDKDLRDISREVLEKHMTGWEDYSGWVGVDPREDISYEVFKKGIMPARISNELVRPYRDELNYRLTQEEGVTDIKSLKAWTIQNITVDDTGNYYNCPISPVGVYELRHSDAHSRDIFFVAACRSLKIPAYLDNATNILYVWNGTKWETVSFEDETAVQPSATLNLNYRPTAQLQRPTYWVHFTLAKYRDGDFETFDFEEDERMATFPAVIALEPGYYCLTTGNRYADGEVLVRREYFNVGEGEQLSKQIILRELAPRNTEKHATIDPELELFGDMATVADYAGPKGMVFVFLGDYREPSKHLVKELQTLEKEYRAWGGNLYLTAPASAQAPMWKLPNTECVLVPEGKADPFETRIIEALGLEFNNDYPLVAVVNERGEILYHSEGYKIGLAEQVLKAVR